MRKQLVVDPSRCTGCQSCQIACSARWVDGYNPRWGRLRVEDGPSPWSVSVTVCHQCSNAFCAKVCPAGAIVRDDATGALRIDVERCSGCALCAEFCPWHLIEVVPDRRVAVKCDLCGGMEPECVRFCSTRALSLVEVI